MAVRANRLHYEDGSLTKRAAPSAFFPPIIAQTEILELQLKFKEDRKKIAQLRSKRNFNPY